MNTQNKFHLALARPGFASLLASEFSDRWNLQGQILNPAAVLFDDQTSLPPLQETIFVRQFLPRASHHVGSDMPAAVQFIRKKLEVMIKRANRQSGRWTLHAFAMDDDPCLQRATKTEKAVLAMVKKDMPGLFKRYCPPEAFTQEDQRKDDVLMQIYVPTVDDFWFSIASVPGISPFVGGSQRMKRLVGAPSRSASKLEEAFVWLGLWPKAGETAVDLGAAPGGWTFALASHGANVTAIDHGELEIPNTKKLRGKINHVKENGLKFLPLEPVDWLCCDMLIGSRETLRVLETWLAGNHMRAFVANIKLPQAKPWPVIKEALELLTAHPWADMKVRHLFHDRQEITLMGRR